MCEETADRMVRMRDNNPLRFSNLHLLKTMANKVESVHTILQRETTFQLKKVKVVLRVQKLKRVEILMRRGYGRYICVLEDVNGARNHCIGVDCQERLIYDLVCVKPMRLTMANLVRCTGQYDNMVSGGFTGLSEIVQV